MDKSDIDKLIEELRKKYRLLPRIVTDEEKEEGKPQKKEVIVNPYDFRFRRNA